jgi:hypothetical protein
MRHIKRELRYIRYRICRNIYYADQCPVDNRKNYKEIGKGIVMAIGFTIVCLIGMIGAVMLA